MHLPATHLPTSTYRLQLHAGFPFAAAQKILPYLARLGITDVYLSPIWAATPGSTHGYDVTDHTQVNPELGGLEGFRAFAERAQKLGLGIILDFVPNHMGIAGGHNPYWEDVLRHGQASRYAHFFDIAWQPLTTSLKGKVLLPVLGDHYGRVLESGELKLEWDSDALVLRYWERRFPLSAQSVAAILAQVDDDAPELTSIRRSLEHLPAHDLSESQRQERAGQYALDMVRLKTLLDESKPVRKAFRAALDAINADPTKLDAVIAAQHYRLACWKVAAEEINYRRFFDINDLAALRMEDPRVFAWAHSLLFGLIGEGLVQGVRLDHTDGLYDPAGYFRAVQENAPLSIPRGEGHKPLYLLAEKILEPGEKLPPDWAIHGTTGYDFLAQLNSVFVQQASENDLTDLYRDFTGDPLSYADHLYQGKSLIGRLSLPGEINVLAARLKALAEQDVQARDFTLKSLRDAIREVIACFPVYRSYVRENGEREPADDALIARAIAAARANDRREGQYQHLAPDPAVFDYLHAVLTLKATDEPKRQAYANFALKFQQLTGPMTAKGAEDTAFYRYARLVSLNEVGGEPGQFGVSLPDFHALMREQARQWPHAMNAGSTHDTKRGEDTRARINVLSEIPGVWRGFLVEWDDLFNDLQENGNPSRLDIYTLLQNALGAFPLSGTLKDFPDRLSTYMLKAAKEAKLHTSWTAPDEAYEAALDGFTRQLLTHPDFLAGLGQLHRRISPYGAQNGLSAALVRLTAPGVPDTYQGCEGWNQSLVDPDNRRPVDYAALGRVLARLEKHHDAQVARDLLANYQDGAVKVMLTWAALRTRQEHADLFAHGDYHALDGGKHLLAFARQHGKQVAVTVAPRLTLSLTQEKQPWALGESWGSCVLTLPASGTYTNVLTGEKLKVRGEKVALAEVLEHFPAALLIRSH